MSDLHFSITFLKRKGDVQLTNILHIVVHLSILLFSMATGEVESKAWNLHDVVVQPGQVLIYKLPLGNIQYLVSESSFDFLPDWVDSTSRSGQIIGLPKKENSGKDYFFQVKSLEDLSSSDFFKVEIRDYEIRRDADSDDVFDENHDRHNLRHHHTYHPLQSTIQCKKSKSRTMASVILSISLDDREFDIQKQVIVLEGFNKFYNIPLEALRLVSSSEIGDGTLFDDSALVAGPGDVVPNLRDSSHQYSNKDDDSHAIIRWIVGCGSVQKEQMEILQRVEKEAANGTLRLALGYGVIGWYVTNQKPKNRQRRVHRGIYATPTPTISAIPPTAFISHPPPKEITPITKELELEPIVTPAPVVETTSDYISTTSDDSTTSKSTKIRSKTGKTKKYSTKSLGELTPSPSPFTKFQSIKSFDVIEVQVGEVFHMDITSNFFTSPPVSLEILAFGGVQLREDSWIKISRTGTDHFLYGIPLMKHEGLQDYVLQGSDGQGGIAKINMKFKVQKVTAQLHFEANMIFKNIDYDSFVKDVDIRMNLAQSIASSFGDRPASDVLMTRFDRGSVDYWWTNSTLFKFSNCPENHFQAIQGRIIDPSNQRVNAYFLDKVNELGLSYVEFHAQGHCLEKGMGGLRAKYIKGNKVTPRMKVLFNTTSLPAVIYRYPVESEMSGVVGEPTEVLPGSPTEMEESELLKQIIIPVLIVVALVLLSAVVACLVCRRRDKKHTNSSDSTELVSKGAPVIFAHELNDVPPTLSPRALVPGGGRSPRPPNYHRRGPQAPGYNDFYATEGLMSGQPRYVSS